MKYLLFIQLICCQIAYAGMPEGYEAYTRGNYAAAFAEFSVAAKQDHPAAQNMVAAMYAQGRGVERDYKQALDWLYRAQALGSPEAMFNLARLLEEGLGEPKNPGAALKYYREAAYLGFKPAIQRLKSLEAQGLLVTNSAPSTKSPSKPRPAAVDSPTVPDASPVKPVAQVKPVPPVAKPRSLPLKTAQVLPNTTHSVRKLFVGANDTRPALKRYLNSVKTSLAKHIATLSDDSEMMLSIVIQKDGRIGDIEVSSENLSDRHKKIVDLIRKIDGLPPLPVAILADYDELDVSIKLPMFN